METLINRFKPLRYLAAPAVALTLWLLSSRSTLPMPPGIPGLDKVAHFIAYAVLALALALWPKATAWRLHPLRTALIIIAIASVYGGVDELHQSFVPGRDMSVYDWLADTLGAVFGVAGFGWWRARHMKARLGANVKTVDSNTVQRAFDRCTWGNTRETAADWLNLLSGTDKAACKHLFDRVFLESPDGTDIKALFSDDQIRMYLTGFNKPLNRSHLERRRKVWRFLYLGERLPIPELDWTLEK